MITKITQKEYRTIRYKQKTGMIPKTGMPAMLKCRNNLYYKSDKSGLRGQQELYEFDRQLKLKGEGQSTLF